MKVWLLIIVVTMYGAFLLFSQRDTWGNSAYDVYIFEAPNGMGLAVVTPDPVGDEVDWPTRIWRADVHVRVGDYTLHREILFRADTIARDTVQFIETAWGPELHIFEAHPDQGPGQQRRRRYAARADQLEELTPARGHGPFYAGAR